MSQRISGIERICRFAFAFSNMDTVFISPKSEVLFEHIFNKVPEPLTPYYENTVGMLKLHDLSSEYDVVFHSNSYRLNFVSARVYDGTEYIGSLILGPFLLEEPTILIIEAMISENNMSISLKNIIGQYYSSMPLVSTYKAKTIADFLAFVTGDFHPSEEAGSKIGEITYSFSTEDTVTSDIIRQNNELSMEAIEKRYNAENTMLHAVESGNKEILDRFLNNEASLLINIPDRIPNDPLRSRKNFSFVANTLLRKAAEKGGLHPIYIDSISEKFAIKIEKCTTIQQIIDLNREMFFSYSDAVRKLALKDHSPLIRKAIEFIRINLNQELSLDNISIALHCSPFTLSRQFKKETGESIIEYINRRRINEALYILENQSISVTDTAYMIGFNDVNYFIKVFKKVKGLTPSEFRNNTKIFKK